MARRHGRKRVQNGPKSRVQKEADGTSLSTKRLYERAATLTRKVVTIRTVARDPTASSLALRLFGPYDAQQNGSPLPRTRTRTEQWLLALLVLRHDREVERTWLAAQFWPDSLESQALYNLRRSLSDLRRVLGGEAYRLTSPTAHTVRLDLSGACVDVVTFDQAVARRDVASLERAVELYRGPLLEGCLEEWVLPERERREEAYLAALETLAEHAADRQHHAEAVRYLRHAVAIAPLRETAQQALLRALAALGDLAGASAAYHQFRLRLHEELRSEPTPETAALYRQIRRESRQRRHTSPAVPTIASPRHLPRPLTDLVGREKEREEIETCLASTRLLTLVGTGGIGKTRLAVAVAQDIADEYVDGAWFVELAPLSASDLVPQAVAATLGVPEEPERTPVDTLATFLKDRRVLLILDNCEHLVEVCARLAETLLGACPSLRILATSRQSLGVNGEQVWRVPSLSLPIAEADDASPRMERLMASESARLFVERARAAHPAFQVTAENAEHVGQVCRLLDGIPLALELAAAWAKAMTVEQLASRLDRRFQLLTGGSRTALPRQQTLRATLDWSYQLLSAAEMTLLRRLSIFVGGWTLEAAEAVCEDESIPSGGIVGLLSQLIDKSLVVFGEREGQARYHLLETTREYAAELWAPDDRQAVAGRHADYFLRLALTAREVVKNAADGQVWGGRLHKEQENLRTALVWWRLADTGMGSSLALTLWQYGVLSHNGNEAREWIARLQQEGDLPPTPTTAEVYRVIGEWANWLGEATAARRLWEKALEAATACADQPGIAATLLLLGGDDMNRDAYAQAQARLETALAGFEALGDIRHAAKARNSLGLLAYVQGDNERAQRLLTESLELGRQRGDGRIMSEALEELSYLALQSKDYDSARTYAQECLRVRPPAEDYGKANLIRGLGGIAASQGDYACAEKCWQEALALYRECGYRPGEGWTFSDMSRFAGEQGKHALAWEYLRQSLRIFAAQGEIGNVVFCLRRGAQLAAAQGDRECAACLWGYIERTYARNEWPIPARERQEWDHQITALRSALRVAAFEIAWTRGQAMTTEDAITCALPEMAREPR